MPTISTSSPTLTMPVSTRPVTTVPRPEIENTASSGGRHDQGRAVHLRGAGDHVLHIIGVARAVDVGVMARLGFILDVGGRNGDAALALFRRLVDIVVRREGGAARLGEDLGDRRGER